jgi:hypothetical protein
MTQKSLDNRISLELEGGPHDINCRGATMAHSRLDSGSVSKSFLLSLLRRSQLVRLSLLFILLLSGSPSSAQQLGTQPNDKGQEPPIEEKPRPQKTQTRSALRSIISLKLFPMAPPAAALLISRRGPRAAR